MLAEIYEENAANQYVVDRFYEDEDVDGFNEDKYSDHKIEDRDEFNKFQGDRNKPDNVVKPMPSTNEQGKASYGYNKDIRTTLVNIDGKFRPIPSTISPRLTAAQCGATVIGTENVSKSSSTEFYSLLAKQYKNVTSVKVSSLEFENSFYTFTSLDPTTNIGRGNTTFSIGLSDYEGTPLINVDTVDKTNPAVVTIPDGNYNISEFITSITSATQAAVYKTYGITGTTEYTSDETFFYFAIIQDPVTIKFTLKSNFAFSLVFPQTNDCFTKNGIGYNMGFYYTTGYNSNLYEPPYTILADARPDVVHDTYVYLVINDWYQIRHQYPDQTELTAFIKIPLTVPKFAVQYDNVQLDTSSKEYFFPQPTNIQKLEISVVDAYGSVLNMNGGSFSMSFAINEILQSSIYEKMLQI
jgi:hypothetical protein